MTPHPDGSHAFTIRVPEPEYSAAKAYGFLTGVPLNEVVVRAIKEFLVNHGDAREVEAIAARARDEYRAAVARLRDT